MDWASLVRESWCVVIEATIRWLGLDDDAGRDGRQECEIGCCDV